MISALVSSPEALESATEADRLDLLREVLERLGPAWTRSTVPAHGREIGLRHEQTQTEFVIIPGGRMQMGLSDADLEELSRYVEMHDGIAYSLEYDGKSALPPHPVTMRPFLCAREPRLDSGARDHGWRQAKERGFRLPSEAELEWILRDGARVALTLGAAPVPGRPGEFTFQPSRFGLQTLLVAHWAADDWHPDYQGAPETSVPWLNGDLAGVCRSTFPINAMVSEDDIATLLAALRSRGAENMPAVMRACRDLPFD